MNVFVLCKGEAPPLSAFTRLAGRFAGPKGATWNKIQVTGDAVTLAHECEFWSRTKGVVQVSLEDPRDVSQGRKRPPLVRDALRETRVAFPALVSKVGETYQVKIPDLPAYPPLEGTSISEVLDLAEEGLEAHLMSLLQQGQQVPMPNMNLPQGEAVRKAYIPVCL